MNTINNTDECIEGHVEYDDQFSETDDVSFCKKTGILSANAFSSESYSYGSVELNEEQTRAIYEEMKKYFEGDN